MYIINTNFIPLNNNTMSNSSMNDSNPNVNIYCFLYYTSKHTRKKAKPFDKFRQWNSMYFTMGRRMHRCTRNRNRNTIILNRILLKPTGLETVLFFFAFF